MVSLHPSYSQHAAESLLMTVNFGNSFSPIRGLNPGPSGQQASILPLDHSASWSSCSPHLFPLLNVCLKIWIVVINLMQVHLWVDGPAAWLPWNIWFMDISQCLGISLGVYRSLPDAFCMIDDFQALPMIPGRLLALFAFHLFVMDTISFFQTFCPTLSFSIYCLKDEIS